LNPTNAVGGLFILSLRRLDTFPVNPINAVGGFPERRRARPGDVGWI